MSVVSVYCSHLKKAKCWKSIGFIMFSLTNLSKMSVLSVLDSKNVIKQNKNHVFCSTSYIFSENQCAKMHKTKKVQKSSSFYSENFHRNRFWRLLFQKPAARTRFLKVLLRSAAGRPRCCFTLCVCFCVVPSLNRNENPIRSATSVREKRKTLASIKCLA